MNTHIPRIKPPIVTLSGRFDAHSVAKVQGQLAAAHTNSTTIIVDLAAVTFIDSSALGLLVQYMKRCRAQGGDIYLCSLNKSVQIIFELTRMNQSFNIFTNVDAAERTLAEH